MRNLICGFVLLSVLWTNETAAENSPSKNSDASPPSVSGDYVRRSSKAVEVAGSTALEGRRTVAVEPPTCFGPQSRPAVETPYQATERYAVKDIEGWNVLVNKGFLVAEPKLADETLTLLRFQLYQIVRRLPAPMVAKLQKVRIWVEEAEPHHPCMAYHPDPNWLRKHDMNPDKARCVEVANARTFLKWTLQQPWMVLHELAHGYHHQFLQGGYQNAEVLAAYRAADADKTYESVLHFDGRKVRAYAIKNQMEYFAEATEAYFGTNDFYPYVRSELKEHDPRLFQLLGELWDDVENDNK